MTTEHQPNRIFLTATNQTRIFARTWAKAATTLQRWADMDVAECDVRVVWNDLRFEFSCTLEPAGTEGWTGDRLGQAVATHLQEQSAPGPGSL